MTEKKILRLSQKPGRIKFAKQLRRMLLESYSAVAFEEKGTGWTCYRLDTPAGELVLTPLSNWVAGRFTDPKRARRIIKSLGQYTGKWNFHFAKRADINEALRFIDWSLFINLGMERTAITDVNSSGDWA